MKFKMIVSYKGSKDTWEEVEDQQVEDAHAWSVECIQQFNNTLQPGEKARELHSVEILDVDSKKDHDWEKTNLVTIIEGKRIYDTHKCRSCGITAKRFGLGDIVLDWNFKAKVYQRCDTSKKHLEKKALKERVDGK